MTQRDERMKASSVFANTAFLFGKVNSFAEAFPHIAEVKVEVEEESDSIWRKPMGKRTYTKETIREFFDCTNPSCYNGGISIGDVLRLMSADRKMHFQTSAMCQGYEESRHRQVHLDPLVEER